MPDKKLEKKILELNVYCVNRDDGCEWVGEILSLDNHLAKQCGFVHVDCKLEPFGCKEKLLRKDMLAHENNLFCHMGMIKNKFEAPEQKFGCLLREEDKRMEQLTDRIDTFEMKITDELKNKSSVKWMPIIAHQLLSGGAGVRSCNIPEHLVPRHAKEVQLFLSVHCNNSAPKAHTHCITVYVEERGVCYAKYSHVTTYKQTNSWNNNTENLWLPMPTNRTLHVNVPRLSGNVCCNLSLTGYR